MVHTFIALKQCHLQFYRKIINRKAKDKNKEIGFGWCECYKTQAVRGYMTQLFTITGLDGNTVGNA